jgi:hypothetical protein
MQSNVKVFPVPAPPIKNMKRFLLGFLRFLYIMSSRIMRCSLFNCCTSDENSLPEMISSEQLGTISFPLFFAFIYSFFSMDKLYGSMPSMLVEIGHLHSLFNLFIASGNGTSMDESFMCILLNSSTLPYNVFHSSLYLVHFWNLYTNWLRTGIMCSYC